MQTWSFIGSDKNAGKTTALNFVHKRLHEQGSGPLCLTSIGINGEPLDSYENQPKPQFQIYRGEYFVSAAEHLKSCGTQFDPLYRFAPPGFSKEYLLGRSRDNIELIIEGPNNKQQLLLLKQILVDELPQALLLLDGSIDRQFIADPRISDQLFFALLLSDRSEQQRKTQDLLTALRLPGTDAQLAMTLRELLDDDCRALLLDEQWQELYRTGEVPFLDTGLKAACRQHREQACVLYLNGALTRSLFEFLSDFERFFVVLDNFTLYQNISVHEGLQRSFAPQLSLLQPLRVERIFLNRQAEVEMEMPEGIPVTDLFRDEVSGLCF